jgi:hypothetical protein
MKITKLTRVFLVLFILFLITSCSKDSSLFSSATTSQINGSITQETRNIDTSGTIRLMPEKYFTMTLEPSATIEPSEYIEVELDKNGSFVIENIEPGNYYLNVEVVYTPCFLGAPGQIFNGAMVSFMENWSPIGFSYTDGLSFITGLTEVFEIKPGKPMEITLDTPKCY